jgi:hypothetical protein
MTPNQGKFNVENKVGLAQVWCFEGIPKEKNLFDENT